MTDRVTEYRILTANSAGALTGKVADLLNVGWQPLGGVSIAMTPSMGPDQYAQAMVKAQPAWHGMPGDLPGRSLEEHRGST